MNRSVGRSICDVAVLIVAYRAAAKLDACLRSVEAFLPDSSVHVWDNSGVDHHDVRELATRWPRVNWHLGSANLGFAAAVNRLVETIPDGHIFLLNPDAELTSALPATFALLNDARIAAVAPLVIEHDDSAGSDRSPFTRRPARWDVAHKKLTLLNALFSRTAAGPLLRGTPLSNLYRRPPIEVDGYLTGACLVINRAAWDQVGTFDESYFLYGEEGDWQWRARNAGWRLVLADEIGAIHRAKGTVTGDSSGSSRSSDLLEANIALQLQAQRGAGSADKFLAGATALDGLKRLVRRVPASRMPESVVIVVDDRGADRQANGQVALACELARTGHSVCVVSLGPLGGLATSLPTSVRLVRRPWWVTSVPLVGRRSVLVVGSTARERAYARLWRLRPGRSSVAYDYAGSAVVKGRGNRHKAADVAAAAHQISASATTALTREEC